MKPYNLEDFIHNEAWLIFRVDTQVQKQPVDIYLLLDLPRNQILIHELVVSELIQAQADQLLKQGLIKKGILPPRVLLTKGDPAEFVLRKSTENLGINLELVPAPYIEKLIAPLKKSFGQQFYSPSSMPYACVKESTDEFDQDTLKYMVPDSYDLCSCASGIKYKFCCKKIFSEIMEAMTAAEEGRLSDALGWIARAKNIVGESAEIVCRESIVYSFFDSKKSEEILGKCLSINANHPRAHYLRAITLNEQGDIQGAISEYETAIANYPKTDHYHLNEAYNNLGTIYHGTGDLPKAKAAWEQALLHLPSDKMTKRNLEVFIYRNDASGLNEINTIAH